MKILAKLKIDIETMFGNRFPAGTVLRLEDLSHVTIHDGFSYNVYTLEGNYLGGIKQDYFDQYLQIVVFKTRLVELL